MNLSEYKLIIALTNKVGEPELAIMIAEDALDLGKRVFIINKNIEECQKKIDKTNNHIDNMTKEQAVNYLNYRCSSCDTFHEYDLDELDEDGMEEAVEEAKHMAEHKIKIYEHDMFHLMQDYESIMGKSYNIEYFVNKFVNNIMDEVMVFFDKNKYLALHYY